MGPFVSNEAAVYAAVQVLPPVFVYMILVSAIETDPDWNVTTGPVCIGSLAVNESVTTSFTFANVFTALLDIMPTLLSVGGVLSKVTEPVPLVTGVPSLPTVSV